MNDEETTNFISDNVLNVSGDTKTPFTMQSCSKPFTYAVCLNELGSETVHQFVGQEPSGRMFNNLCLDYRSVLFLLYFLQNLSRVKNDLTQTHLTLIHTGNILQFWMIYLFCILSVRTIFNYALQQQATQPAA